MRLALEERETNLSMMGDDHTLWRVYSDDPIMQRKIEKIGADVVRVSEDGTYKEYILRANQVSFRKGEKREVSDEQRAISSANMKILQEKRKNRVVETVENMAEDN